MAGSVFHRGTVFSRQLDIDASGNATVSGNLTVDGSTTTISTTNTVIKDKLIELGNGVTGTPSGDAGIIIERGSSTNATIIWDESADTFVVGTTSATGASSGNLTVTDAALQAASLDISGDIDIDGTSNLDVVDIDGAVQIDNTLTVGVNDTGYDVKFFGDTASAYMQWDASEDDLILGGAARAVVPEGQLVLGSTAVAATAAEINAVADASARTAAAIAVADDHFMFLDGAADGAVKVESIADLATAMAGTGISASSGVLNLDSITTVGAVNSGSITSGFGSIDNGSSAITTTGNISGGDITASGGDVNFGNGQNANVAVSAVSGTNTTGKSLTLKAGPGTGSGAGGDIIFQTANAGGSGSSANSLATALTISDDLSATFAGEVIVSDGNLKLGSTAVGATAAEINAVCDASARSAATVAVADDHFIFFDGAADGASKVESIADFVAAIAGSNLSASNGVLSASGGGSTDLNGLSAAVVDVAADSIGIIDANDSNNSKKESIADLMTAVAGSQATTGLTASSGTLVLTDLHPVGVDGSANQLLTDNGNGTVTSEAKLLCDGATTTIGNGTAEDAMLAFDGNAQDFRIGIDDGTDVFEIGHGTTMGTNTAISVNSSGQVTAFNIPAAAVAQASDHIIFLDGGATGAPKAESIDDFLTAIAGSGISVSSSQLTASGGTDLNGLSAAVVDVAADSIAIIDANDSNASKKESIADFVGAIAGSAGTTGLTHSNGVLSISAANTVSALAAADGLPGGAASSSDQIIAVQVFSG